MPEWVSTIAEMVTSLAVLAAMVFAIVNKCRDTAAYAIALIKKGDWPAVIKYLAELMAKAETLLPDGSTRKDWVINSLKAAGKISNYEISDEDIKQLSDLIDTLSDMSKVVNADNVDTDTSTK